MPLKVCSAVRHEALCMTLQKTEKVKPGNAQCETALRIWMASFYGEGAGWRAGPWRVVWGFSVQRKLQGSIRGGSQGFEAKG